MKLYLMSFVSLKETLNKRIKKQNKYATFHLEFCSKSDFCAVCVQQHFHPSKIILTRLVSFYVIPSDQQPALYIAGWTLN